jgi:L-fuculose-phosphate aldolase
MPEIHDPRPQMIEIARLMYGRKFTNSAGGNISCRVNDLIYVSPRGLGSRHRWDLREDMILVLDREENAVLGDPAMISRENRVHLYCYRHFPEIGAVIHAHPRYLSVFATFGRPLPPTLDYTRKFGIVPVVPQLPAHSAELAEAVVEKLTERKHVLQKNGLGLILAGHGVVTVGGDLSDAYDVLERLEWSAQVHLLSGLLPDPPAIQA